MQCSAVQLKEEKCYKLKCSAMQYSNKYLISIMQIPEVLCIEVPVFAYINSSVIMILTLQQAYIFFIQLWNIKVILICAKSLISLNDR